MAEQQTINLGIVSIKNMGEYSSGVLYEKLNVVTYNGSSYCALKSTQGNLPTNTEYWQLYAEKGDVGNTGPQGPQGPKPVKGVDYFTESDKAEFSSEIAYDVNTEVTQQLGNLSSATPLAVSSVSGMTDTSRIYVNTSDGKWYWYNGSAWTVGGVYQATGIARNSIDNENLTTNLSDTLGIKENYFEYDTLLWGQGGINNETGASTTSQYYVRTNMALPFKNTLKITVNEGYVLHIATYSKPYEPTNNFISYSNDITGESYFKINPNYYYKFILSKSNEASISKTDVSDNLSIKELLIENSIEYESLKPILSNLLNIEKNVYDFNYVQGSISSQTGEETVSTTRIRTPFIKFNNDLVIKIEYSYKIILFKYDKEKNYISNTGFITYYDKVSIDKNCYYRIAIGKTNDSDITTSEKSNVLLYSYQNNNTVYKNYNDFKNYDIELYNNNYWLVGDLSTSDGSVVAGTIITKHSVPIEVIQGKYIVVEDKKDCSLSNYVMFYDENNNFISYDWAVGKLKTIVPSNAKYCMFRIRDNSLGFYSVKLSDNNKLNTNVRIISDTPNIKLVAHRGYYKNYPEASRPAYVEAGENSFWGAKIDVCETSDNKFVCSHDATIDRVLNGTGTIANMTLSQVQSYSYKDYPDLHLITLEEALSICKLYNMYPVIEMKHLLNNTTSVERVYNILKSYGLEKSCLCQCSDGERTYLTALRNLTKEIPIMEWRASFATNLDYWKQFIYSLDNACMSLSLIDFNTQFEEYADDVKTLGYPLCGASTNNINDIKSAINDYGANLIVTGEVTYEDIKN